MKFTLSWLKTFLATNASVETIVDALNAIGFEVENVTNRAKELAHFKVAEIVEAKPHPNADKLRVCKVASDDAMLQIVCGAPNARAGIKVILAKVGTLIPNGNFQIKAAEIRGVASNGMLCSANELMIGIDSDGIVELPNDAVIGEEFAKYYGLDDPVIEISVTPNRGDCLGVYYIAKELAAKGVGVFIGSIDHDNSYSKFATLDITNVTNKPSPEWLQLLLKNIGQTPISAIVDITNYICISFARPMHAYDKDKLDGALEVSFAREAEKFSALNNKEYELSSEDLVIHDRHSVQSLAGIIGGANSSCDMQTKNITLEAAIFDPLAIAKSGRRHRIDTDSRQRLERGVDPLMSIPMLKLAAEMIIGICGGEYSTISSQEKLVHVNKKIAFDPKELMHVTGLSLPTEEIIKILHKLDFTIELSGDILHLAIPSFRHDINIKEDIVEEIIRIYGYEHIPLSPLSDRHIARMFTTTQRRSCDARRILANRGYDELITYSFMDDKRAGMFGKHHHELQIQNPISTELCYMRPSIIANMLEIIAKNLARSIGDLAFFEIGPVFNDIETLSITAARIGNIISKNPHSLAREIDAFDIKGDLDLLLKEMGLTLDKCSLGDAPAYYHPYRSASIQLGKNQLGYFGELHPEILESYDITHPVIAFELNLNVIPEGKLKYGYKGKFIVSDYQPVNRDFAFLVNVEQSAGEMILMIQNLDKKLIRDVCLFDVYSGDKIEQGKKSLAFNVIFQADDRTLRDNEINALSSNIIDNMAKKYGAALRS